MKNLKIAALLSLVLLLAACETEIEFNGKVTKPVLVTNCIVQPDSVLQVKVTASRFFLSNSIKFTTIDNATVTLFVNGAYQETLTKINAGLYRSAYVAEDGATIRLSITAEGYEDVWSEVSVPQAPVVQGIDTSLIAIDSSTITSSGFEYDGKYYPGELVGTTYDRTYQYTLRFTDPAEVGNYYRLIACYTYQSGLSEQQPMYLNDFTDVVFGSGKDNVSGVIGDAYSDNYNVFSDELINGDTHTMTFKYKYTSMVFSDNPNNPSNDNMSHYLRVELQSISKSYYLYMKAMTALDNAETFLAEPVQIPTNIHQGLGLLGAKSGRSRTFVLPK